MNFNLTSLSLGAAVLFATTGPMFASDVSAPPASPFSGQFEGWVAGFKNSDPAGPNLTGTDLDIAAVVAFGADLRLRMDLADVISVQIDGSIDGTGNSSTDERYGGSKLVGAHVNWNDPEMGLLGAFGAVGSTSQYYNGTEDNANFWAAGAEGQLYLDAATLYLQAGYLNSNLYTGGSPEDSFHNALFVRGVGRYFVSPDLRLQAEFSYAKGKQDTDEKDMNIVGWGARGDYQVASNVSIFAAYTGAHYDNGVPAGDTGSFTEHQLKAGLTLNLGGPDLLTTDRHGPNLDMPWLSHWVSAGDLVD